MRFRTLVGFLLFLGLVATAPAQTLELVESFPEGSDFDQPDLRQASEVWLEMINGARREILWQTFYLSHEDGEATGPILDALRAAAGRGVSVKLLVDETFLKTYPEPLGELGRLKNVEVRLSPIGRWYGGVMHAKALFVDETIGYLGSQNLDWRSLTQIRELGVRFDEPKLLEDYVRVFRWEWEHYQDETPPPQRPRVTSYASKVGEGSVYATFSPIPANAPHTASDEAELLKLIRASRERLEIALLSYSPLTHDRKTFYPTLDNALREASVRGVKVRLLVSHWAERPGSVEHLLSLDALANIEVRACRIPPAERGEIPFARVHHSKYLVSDGRCAWLGTSNWDHGYFHESRNLGMVMHGGDLPPRMGKLFDHDWSRASSLSAPD